MTWAILAWRNLLVRPGRAAALMLGYATGVGVMIVLLSVGDAMLDQSRDVSLVGGGELTALPQGIDREALRSGGMSGMFFSISGARFVVRQLIGGARYHADVRAVSPAIEQKRLTLRAAGRLWTVRAGADLPDESVLAGTGLQVVAGQWSSNAGDRAWAAPSPQQLYDEIDHFHQPRGHDSTWAEWHYANVSVGETEWWYFTWLVGGDLNGGRWGGQVIATHRLPDGSYHRYMQVITRDMIRYDTTRADLSLGENGVRQVNGRYHFLGRAGAATFDFDLAPDPERYFPAVDLGSGADPSGYAVAALSGSASGRICDGPRCSDLHDVPAYHDHNWGTWRAVTWQWGAGRGSHSALLYGGVIRGLKGDSEVPFFLALEDAVGILQIYRFRGVEQFGRRDVAGEPGISGADSFRITATRGDDSLIVAVRVLDIAASRSRAAGPDQVFLQMRGAWVARGRAAGVAVADSGRGFFETWATRPPRTPR